MINSIIDENQEFPNVNILGKIFEKQSYNMISYYENIKSGISPEELEEIDFRTYDKISFLINEFCNKMVMIKCKTPKEYLHQALNIATDELALFIDVQGRLVNNSSNAVTKTYEILSNIIIRLRNQVDDIIKVL
ncbi:MAG: hypothetical protein ACI398_06915, partial [Clostridium sp.]